MNTQPLVVAYGMGVDSTAMLVAMFERGIRPDLILFADTGGEKPETYAYLDIINAWLACVGFPPVTVVRYVPTRAPYTTLEGKCLANQAMPSLAYGMHTCATVFKAEPQAKFVATWDPAIACWAAGGKVRRAIGYDNGCQDKKRRAKADKVIGKMAEKNHIDARRYENWYALQDWGIDRAECIALIERAGLPVPAKSACWFCPAAKKSEIVDLRDRHPELFERALAMEARALTGKHGGGTVKGLGRNFAWADLATATQVEDDKETLRP